MDQNVLSLFPDLFQGHLVLLLPGDSFLVSLREEWGEDKVVSSFS